MVRSRHCALEETISTETNYRWYVPATQPDQDGETIFAAYLWDDHKESKEIVGGVTLREAHANLNAFLLESDVLVYPVEGVALEVSNE